MTRVIGVDYGSKRVGIAMSDELGLVAAPVAVETPASALDRIHEMTRQHEISEIVVGLPLGLNGAETASTRAARAYGLAVQEKTGTPVVFVDERFTSRMADAALLESGMKRRRRRETVDKVAAVIILQAHLDGNSRRGDDVEQDGRT